MTAALAMANPPQAEIRRFTLPDLDRHGTWLVPRLLKTYPHLNQRTVIGWLKSMMYDNEHLFLWQPNSVALAQMERAQTLAPKPMVRERFVWCRDQKDKAHLAEAAGFYERFNAWAKNLGCDTLLVMEMTDVPEEQVKKVLGGRLFQRAQTFAKVEREG